ncbi:MAG: hypothetical protein HC888_16285, partial [Candidatus Competibacteraceae bacterium]|nr:hypothetical protein [Candidatus Competibacteraceae bacterium]
MAAQAPALTSTKVSRRTVFKGLWKDSVARAALIVLACFYAAAALADLITPYGMEFNDAAYGNAPATLIHIQDEKGNLTAPYVFHMQQENDPVTYKQIFVILPDTKYPIKLFCKGDPYKLLGLIPMDL